MMIETIIPHIRKKDFSTPIKKVPSCSNLAHACRGKVQTAPGTNWSFVISGVSAAVNGIFVGTVKKRMAKGTKVPSPATDAYVFDCSIPDFIDPAEYVEAATQENAGTRDQL